MKADLACPYCARTIPEHCLEEAHPEVEPNAFVCENTSCRYIFVIECEDADANVDRSNLSDEECDALPCNWRYLVRRSHGNVRSPRGTEGQLVEWVSSRENRVAGYV